MYIPFLSIKKYVIIDTGDNMNKVLVCEEFWARFKGLMFESDNNTVLIFPRCNSIHTFFMKHPIETVKKLASEIINGALEYNKFYRLN